MEKTRTRNWFITINPNANCYQQLGCIIKSEKCLHYAYIKHSAENESENDGHIHLCIEYKDAKTFTSIQSKFDGAHIEQMQYKNMSYQYLIHKNDSDKKQYSIDDVITNDKEYYINMLDSDEYVKIEYDTLIEEINKGNNTIIALTKVFGYYQIKNNLSMVKAFIAESQHTSILEQYERNVQDLLTENVKLKSENEKLIERVDKLEKELGYLPF